MSKAVMLSIRPKRCEKIVNGEKTIEVRKTRPKLQTPFKCYIYCTMDHPYISVSCGELDKLNYRTNTVCRCNGKVIGEFTCDRIDRLVPANDPYGIYDIDDDYVFQTCLENGALWDYGHGTPLYGWHISDLRIYDQPRDLTEFRRPCPNDLSCEACAMYSNNNGICNNGALPLRRPPQSWCYVEARRMYDLKPCPFCGGEAILETVDGNSPEECYIYCPECDFESGVYSEPKFIIEKWNRRC